MTPVEKLQAADQLLGEWLTDNTEETFDEVFEVDAARTFIQEAIEELTAPAQRCKYGNEPASCTSIPMDCQCAIDAALEE